MVEKNPWWKNVSAPFPSWEGPVGVKEDGGGCHRAKGWVGKMQVHRAVNNRDKDGEARLAVSWLCPVASSLDIAWPAEIVKLVDQGVNANEVEAAGNTPLHFAAYEGWIEGVELLLSLGAKINASNNAGDRPWHWAQNMGHDDVQDLLVKVGVICPQELQGWQA